MWKWVLITLGIILGLAVFLVILITTINPQGCVDFILTNIDEYNISVDGEQRRVKISTLEGDVTAEDRSYLVRKLIVLTMMAHEDEDYKEASSEYGNAFLEMAEDHTLTEDELLKLKEMHSDIVSDEDVENWIKKAEELEKKDGDFDPDELF